MNADHRRVVFTIAADLDRYAATRYALMPRDTILECVAHLGSIKRRLLWHLDAIDRAVRRGHRTPAVWDEGLLQLDRACEEEQRAERALALAEGR